jgi:hypothetical protein
MKKLRQIWEDHRAMMMLRRAGGHLSLSRNATTAGHVWNCSHSIIVLQSTPDIGTYTSHACEVNAEAHEPAAAITAAFQARRIGKKSVDRNTRTP